MNKTLAYGKKLLIKLLMLIPNIILIYLICGFLYATIGTIHNISEPALGFYKSATFDAGYNIILYIIIIISLIYLFCVTDNKYLFMFKSGITICICLTALIYIMSNSDYKFHKKWESSKGISKKIEYINKANMYQYK